MVNHASAWAFKNLLVRENLCSVRLLRQNLGGGSKHQDVAADERDVQRDMTPDEQRNAQQSIQGNWHEGSEEGCKGGF